MSSRPMDRTEFERVLRLGLGRAVLQLEEHDAAPYRDLILHACLRNLAYDPQREGDRATYMFDVIKATNDRAFYRARILQALRNRPEDWDAAHLCALARLFAQGGDQEARQALYDHVAARIATTDWAGRDDIIALDGLAGFCYVATLLGEQALTKPDFTDDDFLLSLVEERYGQEMAERELSQVAAANRHIAAYLAAVAANRDLRTRQADSPARSYVQVKQMIAAGHAQAWRCVLGRWGKQASAEELKRAAEDLLAETERSRLLGYLYLFQRTSFPLDPSRLLTLADSTDEEIAEAAFAALKEISHPAVRNLALQLIESSGRPAEAVALLSNNFKRATSKQSKGYSRKR